MVQARNHGVRPGDGVVVPQTPFASVPELSVVIPRQREAGREGSVTGVDVEVADGDSLPLDLPSPCFAGLAHALWMSLVLLALVVLGTLAVGRVVA